ncbi:MAG: hypothetical protein HZA90_00460, partial [Verrucomicrobia bacterium]|nr:hypothetical protein [Verrucomicrobiota bacterium]
IQGTASDNGGVAEVQFKLNNEPWEPGHGTTNWHRPKTLTPGSNTVWAYALDAAGNRSVTQQVRFVYVLTGQLTLRTNGVGTITRTFTGTTLEVGQTYTVTAVPGAGQVFSNWTDGAGQVVTNGAACAFKMQTDLILQANFVPNPFVAAKGDYNGLFYPISLALESAGATNSGYFALSLTESASFSGRILMEGQTYSFSGTMPASLGTVVNVPRAGKPAAQVTLQVQPDGTNLTGFVSSTGWESDLLAVRALAGSSNPYAGAYTLDILTNNVPAVEAPPGDGVGAVTVSASGAIQLTGTLADGTAITQSSAVGTNGWWPLYVSLYGGKGLVIGWLFLKADAPLATPFWLKPVTPGAAYYPNGFATHRRAQAMRYLAPTAGQSAVNWTYGELKVDNGNLAEELIGYLAVTNNRVTVWGGSLSNLTVTLNSANGQFSGSFTHPVTRTLKQFQGTLMQYAGFFTNGWGWFLGTNEGGGVHLESSTNAPPEDWVPASLNGKTVEVVPPFGDPFQISFGNSTFSQTGEGGMGNYTYTRLAAGSARLGQTYTMPPTMGGENVTTDIWFTSAIGGMFTNRSSQGVTVGVFAISNQPDLVPTSVSGKAVTGVGPSGSVTTAFAATTFTQDIPGLGLASGSYTWTKYSLAGGLARLNYTSPPQLAGAVAYSECWFTTSQQGTYIRTLYVTPGATPDVEAGTFTAAP